MSYVEGVNLQNCQIGGRLNFFWCGNEKMQKNDFFHKTLISQNLLKEANFQARSIFQTTYQLPFDQPHCFAQANEQPFVFNSVESDASQLSHTPNPSSSNLPIKCIGRQTTMIAVKVLKSTWFMNFWNIL